MYSLCTCLMAQPAKTKRYLSIEDERKVIEDIRAGKHACNVAELSPTSYLRTEIPLLKAIVYPSIQKSV